jgi:histone deacetylase complex regulatory component SIN3
VTDLFQGAPDLLDEFSQFLPTADGSQPQQGGLFGDFFGGGPPAPVPVATHAPETRPAPYEKQKRGAKNQEKETGGAKKRRMVDKEGKGRVSDGFGLLMEHSLIPS